MKNGPSLLLYSLILKSPFLPLFKDRELLLRQDKNELDNLTDFLTKKQIEIIPIFGTHRLRTLPTFTKKPTLFYGNHRNVYDPFLVIACLNIKRVKIVAAMSVAWVFHAPKKNVILVSIRTLSKNWDIVSIGRKYAMMAEGLNKAQADRLNKQVPVKAVKALTRCESVIIFPDGGLQKKPWFSGIGFIIYDYWHSGMTDLQLQPFCLERNTNRGFMWHNFHLFFHSHKKMQIQLDLGQIFSIKNLAKEIDLHSTDRKTTAKAITRHLESQYHQEFGN